MSTAGYVYVLGFSNGTVKVGRTKNGPQRIDAHKSSARQFGLTVTGTWMSPLHDEWEANENVLKRIAFSLGGTAKAGTEWFSGVTFVAVAEKAQELPFTVRPQGAVLTDEGVRIGALSRRLAAIEKKAEKDAFDMKCASLYLDMGMPPGHVRDDLEDPATADAMDELLREEARIRRAFEITTTGLRDGGDA